MKAKDYFGDWLKFFDKQEFVKILSWIKTLTPSKICPSPENIFRAFNLCPYKDCRVVMTGQDPYPQPNVATGILFGNAADTPENLLSPSLQVIKEAVINYEIPHNLVVFDNTLESWAKQGILMLNSALTCNVNSVGSHTEIWRPFISKFLYNISNSDNGYVFILFGRQAQSFKPFIKGIQHIIEIEHPAYFYRRGKKMPYSVFTDMNKYLKDQYNLEINLYKEYNG